MRVSDRRQGQEKQWGTTYRPSIQEPEKSWHTAAPSIERLDVPSHRNKQPNAHTGIKEVVGAGAVEGGAEEIGQNSHTAVVGS
jgi:hypothetical protein